MSDLDDITPARKAHPAAEDKWAASGEVPDDVPRHGGNGRPWIRHADDADPPPDLARKTNARGEAYWALADPDADRRRGQYMSRASSLGKPLENGQALENWKLEAVVWAMGRDESRVLQSAALGNFDDPGVRKQLGAIVEACLEITRTSAGARKGTALHVLSEQRDAGVDLSHIPTAARLALERYDEIMSCFTIHASETFVVNRELGAAGSFDRLVSPRWPLKMSNGDVITPDDRVIMDLKTNKNAAYFGPCYEVQQAVYQGGRPYSHANGETDWPDGVAPHPTWAIIPHVPIASPADAGLYEVDLREGRAGAALAVPVRRSQARKGGFLPLALPKAPVPAALSHSAVLELLRNAADDAALTRIWEAHKGMWDTELQAMAVAKATELRLGAKVPA